MQALMIHGLFESGAMHGPPTLPAFRNGSGMRGSCMIPQMAHKPGTVLEALDRPKPYTNYPTGRGGGDGTVQ